MGEQRTGSDQPQQVDESDADPEVAIRLAGREDWIEVMDVLEGALLNVDTTEVRERIAADAVLVAHANGSERLWGALVLREVGTDPRETNPDTEPGNEIEVEIEAIALRRRHRDREIGSALIDRARRGAGSTLVAEFDERVRPFYAALGFRIEPICDGRFRGRDVGRSGRE